jgi:hypothetical protein
MMVSFARKTPRPRLRIPRKLEPAKPQLTRQVKFAHKLYFKSCLKCGDGTVELNWDVVASSNTLKCLTCGYELMGKEVRA